MPAERPSRSWEHLSVRDATLARLRRVNLAIARWDDSAAGRRPQPEGLGGAALVSLRATLTDVLPEQDALACETPWDRRN